MMYVFRNVLGPPVNKAKLGIAQSTENLQTNGKTNHACSDLHVNIESKAFRKLENTHI